MYRLIGDKEIPFKKIRGRYRFSRRVLLQWVEGQDDEKK